MIGKCPFTISNSGQYHISKDLSCGNDPTAIFVTANNVDLHFDGHILDGLGTGVEGVLVFGSNVNIFGSGTVKGFQFGITLTGRDDDSPSSGNRIVNITAMNSGTYGFLVVISRQNTITNCTGNNNVADGIFVGSITSGNTLISNTFDGNGLAGIELFDTSNNQLTANEADSNGFGILVDFAFSGNVMQANGAARNTQADLADMNGGCDANTWKANRFHTANQGCIH
jgi:parallel beta-helix repeat protein